MTGGDMTADEAVALLEADDGTFADAWRDLTDEERSAIGAHGFDRFRKITSYVGESSARAERAQVKLDAENAAGADAEAVDEHLEGGA